MIRFQFHIIINRDGQVWKKLKTNNGLYHNYEVVGQVAPVRKTSDPYSNLRVDKRGIGTFGNNFFRLEGDDWDLVMPTVSDKISVATKNDGSLWNIYSRELIKEPELIAEGIQLISRKRSFNDIYFIILDDENKWYRIHSDKLNPREYLRNRQSIKSNLRREDIISFRNGIFITRDHYVHILINENTEFSKAFIGKSISLIHITKNKDIVLLAEDGTFHLIGIKDKKIKVISPFNGASELVNEMIGFSTDYITDSYGNDFLLAKDGTTFILDDKLGLIKTMIPPHIFSRTNRPKNARNIE